MACKCRYSYRKKHDVAVHCRAIEGDMDYCGHQYHCPNTQQWEVHCTGMSCTLLKKKPVKDKNGQPLEDIQ